MLRINCIKTFIWLFVLVSEYFS